MATSHYYYQCILDYQKVIADETWRSNFFAQKINELWGVKNSLKVKEIKSQDKSILEGNAYNKLFDSKTYSLEYHIKRLNDQLYKDIRTLEECKKTADATVSNYKAHEASARVNFRNAETKEEAERNKNNN